MSTWHETYELSGAGIFVSVTKLFPRAQEAHFILGFPVDYFLVFPYRKFIFLLFVSGVPSPVTGLL